MLNSINSIQGFSEYLYNINFIIPSTKNTTIYVYDSTIDDIDINNDIYIPMINTINKTSIYFNQSNGITSFTIPINYDANTLYTNINFIQKNTWIITNKYTINNYTMSISIPIDFVVNTKPSYYYTINNVTIDKFSFVFESGMLNFTWLVSDPITTNNIVTLNQYYIETNSGSLFKPFLNKKVNITYDYPYQYKQNNKFYIIPYMGDGTLFDNYLYFVTINNATSYTGYLGGYDTNNTIYLTTSGNIYTGKIFDIYYNHASSQITYIISLNKLINTLVTYQFNLKNQNIVPVVSITFMQNSLQKSLFLSQPNFNTVTLFINDAINDYIINTNLLNTNIKPSKFYLIAYDKFILQNNYLNLDFVQNNNMKIELSLENKTQLSHVVPTWDNAFRLFNFIKIYLGDQLIEEINEDVFNIYYKLYLTEEKRKQLDQLIKIRFDSVNNKWHLYLPLIFWFFGRPSMSIPTIALPYIDITIKYQLNSLSYVLTNYSNNNMTTITPSANIYLTTDLILLDTFERKQFGSLAHEYVIERYLTYHDDYVNTVSSVFPRRFFGLIKDIHMITKLISNNKQNSFQSITNKYDSRFQIYNTALKYYNLYISNNYIYTLEDQKNYAKYIGIIKNVIVELNSFINSKNKNIFIRINLLITNFSSCTYFDSNYNFLQYLMFFQDAFLSLLNSTKQIYTLTNYIQYMYLNQQIIEEISPISTMYFRANGYDLLAARDDNYFNAAVPYTKFKNSLSTGYYTYTFSLYPTEEQFSGHLNFSYFDDVSVIITSNDLVTKNPYKIHTILKEYNILRIMSGMGGLGW